MLAASWRDTARCGTRGHDGTTDATARRVDACRPLLTRTAHPMSDTMSDTIDVG